VGDKKKESSSKSNPDNGIEPLQPPWKNILLTNVKEAKRSIFIITPTLKTEVVKWITNILLDSPPEGEFKLKIMTKLNEEAIVDGKSDLEALDILGNLQLGPEFKLEFRGVENLNANVFIFDSKKAIVTSGGLDSNSLLSNLEYGFLITDPEMVKKIISDFETFWSSTDELSLPDFRYFISQIQEHDTTTGGFLKLGSAVKPLGTDMDEMGPIEGETLAKKYVSQARDHEEMGEYEEALEFYNKALVATPMAEDILRDKAVLLRDELERYEEALDTFNKILTIDPKSEHDSLEAGKILVKMHRYWDALIKLDITTQANSSNSEAWYLKSIILYDTPDRVKDALLCLDEVIKIDPNYDKAWFLKGEILSKHQERYSEADRCFNTVTRINPKNEEAWFEKGLNLFYNLNQPLDAIKCFDKVTKTNKHSPQGWFYKGLILAEGFKKDQDAIRCFSEAIKLNPEYKEALYHHGMTQFKNLNKPEDAKKSLTQLFELDENNENVLFALGLLYGKGLEDSKNALDYLLKGFNVRYPEEEAKDESKDKSKIKFDQFQDVLKYLDKITLSDSKNPLAWYEKGAILDRFFSRFDDALKCFDEATKIDINFKEAWYDKGIILFSVYGRNDDAIKCLNKVISLDKKDENAWYIKGKALMDNEKYEDALACLEKVTKINPENYFAFENIAKSLIQLSRYKDALEYIEKAIKIDPQNAVLWYDKGNIYLQLRQYPEALKCYKNALNINPNHELALKNFETYSDKNNWV
jgi:tetratricopeptide (TPR) repeat protein